MKSRFSGWFVHILLIIVVLISVIFTALIWITPSYLQHLTGVTTAKRERIVDDSTTADRVKLADIYRPVSVGLNERNKTMQLMSNQVDVVATTLEALAKVRFSNIEDPRSLSKQEYLNYLKKDQLLLLNYGDKTSFGAIKSLLTETPKNKTYTFEHIALDLKGKQVYFLNDDQTEVYTAKLGKGDLTQVEKLKTNENIKRVPVTYRYKNDDLLQYYDEALSVPRYSYLYNRENIGMYVTRLLGTEKSNPASLTTREQGEQTTYTDDSGQKLSVNNKTGLITYTDYLTNDTARQNWTWNSYLTNAFSDLEQLGANLNDVKYSEFDEQEKNVIYRSYIDGFPVISDRDFGTYQIQNRVRNKKIVFSQCSLQVPVPAAGKAVTLPATKDVVKELEASQQVEVPKISGIQIGYSVSQNSTASLVIDLTPTYFVKYNNVWINYEDLINGKKMGG